MKPREQPKSLRDHQERKRQELQEKRDAHRERAAAIIAALQQWAPGLKFNIPYNWWESFVTVDFAEAERWLAEAGRERAADLMGPDSTH